MNNPQSAFDRKWQSLKRFANHFFIWQDVTLHVPSQFKTVHDAVNWANSRIKLIKVTITIQIAVGIYEYDETINIKQDVTINGATPTTTTISSVGSITGSAGAWSVPITVSDASDFYIGGYCTVGRDVTGTGDFRNHEGFWKITNVSGSVVTITNTNQNSSFPTSTLTGGTLSLIPTIIDFNNSVSFGFHFLNSKCIIQNFGVIDCATSNQKIDTGSIVTATVICVNKGGKYGILVANNSSLTISDSFFCNLNTWAGIFNDGYISINNCILNGNAYGVMSFYGGINLLQGSHFFGNNYGIYCLEGSYVKTFGGVGNPAISKQNVTTDVYSAYGSFIRYVNSADADTFSPTIDMVGNHNSYITQS